jgi:hypothetical protein
MVFELVLLLFFKVERYDKTVCEFRQSVSVTVWIICCRWSSIRSRVLINMKESLIDCLRFFSERLKISRKYLLFIMLRIKIVINRFFYLLFLYFLFNAFSFFYIFLLLFYFISLVTLFIFFYNVHIFNFIQKI